MIVKAKVVTNSSEDSKGRVKIEAAGIWENSKEVGDLYPVCNAIPLNEGDVVYVYLFDGDYSNPLVLGKARDNNFDPSISYAVFCLKKKNKDTTAAHSGRMTATDSKSSSREEHDSTMFGVE